MTVCVNCGKFALFCAICQKHFACVLIPPENIEVICKTCNTNVSCFKHVKSLIHSVREEFVALLDAIRRDFESKLKDVELLLAQPQQEYVVDEVNEHQSSVHVDIISNFSEHCDSGDAEGDDSFEEDSDSDFAEALNQKQSYLENSHQNDEVYERHVDLISNFSEQLESGDAELLSDDSSEEDSDSSLAEALDRLDEKQSYLEKAQKCKNRKKKNRYNALAKKSGQEAVKLMIQHYDDDPYDDFLDLHSFGVKEAKTVVNHFLDVKRGQNFEFGEPKLVEIVTGQGNHSPDGIPILKPVVIGMLKKRALKFSDLKGCLKVRL